MISEQIVTWSVSSRPPDELALMPTQRVAQLFEYCPIIDFPCVVMEAGWPSEQIDRVIDLAASKPDNISIQASIRDPEG